MLEVGIGPWAGPVFGSSGAGGPNYSGYALALDFVNNSYWAGGVKAASLAAMPGYAFTRSGIQGALDSDGGVDDFAANIPAINGYGFHCYGALTNLLLNAGQNNPLATQNVTVTAALHTLSFIGTGTVALTGVSTAGPLVGTGANNQVALSFTPTAGTLTVTVTGDVRYAGLMAASGGAPMPVIATVGATAALAAAKLQIAAPALSDQDMLIWANVAAYANTTAYALIIDDGTLANYIEIRQSIIAPYATRINAASALVYNQTVPALVAGQETVTVLRRLAGEWRAGKIVGGSLTWGVSGAGAMPTGLTRIFIGQFSSGGSQINGFEAGAFIRPGTFASDAEVLAAVAEAG